MKEKTSNTGEQPNILIAIPAYGGMIHFRTAEALRLLDRGLTKLGITHTFRYLGNESLITRARNWFANLALIGKDENGKPFTHLLFVDADIIFSPANVVEMFQANLPIVALPYSKKGLDWANVATAAKAGVPAKALNRGPERVLELRDDPTALAPDRVIVLETAGTVADFARAASRIPGFELMIDYETAAEADEFFAEKDTRTGREGQRREDKFVEGRFYLAMPDIAAPASRSREGIRNHGRDRPDGHART